ncbi:MAG: FtsW/RodA/SpoVE family cell cycle protein [Patescibacteria group bacterium]
MTLLLTSSILLGIFSFFNLLGINQEFAIFQLVFLILGAVLFIFIRVIDAEYFKKNYKFFYWLFIFLLISVFVIGEEIRGSKRWIDLYFFNFQPSEIFKVFFIVFIAKFISLREEDMDRRRVFALALLYLFIPFFLVFKQPDLGNALSYVVIFFSIVLFSKIPKKYIVTLVLIAVLALPLSWNVLREYQKQRVVSFFIPNDDFQGTNYNMLQSKISAGSGKFSGRGLGYGTQSKLFFLPESHTDFAYSSLSEQFGFIGALSVIILYFLICLKIIKLIIKNYTKIDREERYYLYYSVGFLSYFCFQIFVNIAMNLGSFPIAGVSLPILSYGGSSIATYALGIALMPIDRV